MGASILDQHLETSATALLPHRRRLPVHPPAKGGATCLAASPASRLVQQAASPHGPPAAQANLPLPPGPPTLTTSVPASWMRAMSARAWASGSETRGVAADSTGRMVTPAQGEGGGGLCLCVGWRGGGLG